MRAGIALGSNLGERLANLCRARAEILRIPGVSLPSRSSSIYETEPVGSEPGAGLFFNAVIEVGYAGLPQSLLDALQAIESSMGRPSKRPRNSPRPIDLDILYAGNLVLSNDEIVIPHPRLHVRRFVLAPLAEIRPDLILPGHEETIQQMLTALRDGGGVVCADAAAQAAWREQA